MTDMSFWQHITIKREVAIKLNAADLAEAFCDMDDEAQAQFFIEVARIAKSWPQTTMPRCWQWHVVGRHLATCSCSNDDARALVQEIADSANRGPE